MSNNSKPWLNSSGYPDPTAYAAEQRIKAEERRLNRVDSDAHTVITAIKSILDVTGFELVDRIHIRHKKSGRTYK